uniref:Uncharacterized protein n=1 Tax=Leersia perrieri TaxID=77586 RepID=A0A0D9XVB2_9ORYZ
MEDCIDLFGVAKTRQDRLEVDRKFCAVEQLSEDTPTEPPATGQEDGQNHPEIGAFRSEDMVRELVQESESLSERKLRVICIVGFGEEPCRLIINDSSQRREEFPRASVSAEDRGANEIAAEILEQLSNPPLSPTR